MILFYLACALWGLAIVMVLFGASVFWIIAAQSITLVVILGLGIKGLRS